MPASRPRVLCLAGDVAGNLGDRAIRTALLEAVRRACPSAECFVVSREVARDEQEFGVHVVSPSAVHLLGKPGFLRSLDLVIFGGGQLLQDDSSQLKNLHWAVVLQALRAMTPARLVGFGLGLGPLNTGFGRQTAARALSALSRLVVRDQTSLQWARQLMGPSARVDLAPDPAINLAPDSEGLARAAVELEHQVPGWGRCGWPLVGVAVRRFSTSAGILPSAWRMARQDAWKTDLLFEQFKHRLAEVLDQVGASRGVRYLFFPMYQAAWQNDAAHAGSIRQRMRTPSATLDLTHSTAREIQGFMQCCRAFLGIPMHSTILSSGAGVPTLALTYAQKGRDYFDALQLGEAVFPVHDLVKSDGVERLASRLNWALDHADELRDRLRAGVDRLRGSCEVYEAIVRELLVRSI